jgi:ketosteroid isomerase-like protein
MNDDRAIGLAFMQALWAGDLVRCGEMMTGDAKWYFQLGMPQARIGRGRIWPAREALQRIVDDLFGKFDDSGFSVEPTRIIADAGSIAIEYEANGRTAKGEAYQNFYVTVLTIREGKVSEVRPYNDTSHMLAMLGD